MTGTLLKATNLAITIDGRELVSNIDLELPYGESLGIVGETGSGKSLTCRAFAGALHNIGGQISCGVLELAGDDIVSDGAHARAGLYGRAVSLIPQNSLSALNPLMRVGRHLQETVKALDPEQTDPKARSLELLERVGLPTPPRVMRQYPHQLSGGMRQRVMIALAIAGRPHLLIADEPTTALDVSVQKEILELLRRLTKDENMALILVSHDLGVIANATQNVAVMYAGTIVEHGPTETVLRAPQHPYTQALLKARPGLHASARLEGIPGTPPPPDSWPPACRFAPRCPHTIEVCEQQTPPLEPSEQQDHLAACHRKHELTPEGKLT